MPIGQGGEQLNNIEKQETIVPNVETQEVVEPSKEELTTEVKEDVATFKSETKTALDTSNDSIGLSPADVEAIQNDSGILEELKAIDEEAENIAEEVKDLKQNYIDLEQDSTIEWLTGDQNKAEEMHKKAEVIKGDLLKKALDLEQDSTLAQYQGDYENSKKLEDESKKIKETIGESEEKKIEPKKVEITKDNEEPYSEDFVRKIRTLYKEEKNRLESIGVSGQSLQVRLEEYKRRVLEPMLVEESKEVEEKEEEPKVEDKTEGKGEEHAEESKESKENKIKKVSYEEWKKTLPEQNWNSVKVYENLNPTYYIDDNGAHYAVYIENGKKKADKLYVNESVRGYTIEVNPFDVEKS